MSTYGQFCPVAQALEIVGERWSLLVIRELVCGSRRFNEIMLGVPLMSRSLLSQRLKTLEQAGVIERHEREGGGGHEYRLSAAGRELEPIVVGLGTWGQRWARGDRETKSLDPVLRMWDVRRNLDTERLPEAEALRSGAIELKGPTRLTRAFPSWLLLSRFAKVERPPLTAAAAR